MNFTKMHGLGNDFVIAYMANKQQLTSLSKEQIVTLCNRKTGIGCDQFIVIYKENNIYNMVIFNPDGSTANACGNATRCVASYIQKHFKQNNVTIKVGNRLLKTTVNNNGDVAVNMGFVSLLLNDGKLHEVTKESDLNFITSNLATKELNIPNLQNPYIVNISNNHAIFITKENNTLELAKKFGSAIENHVKFPDRINVSFVYIKDQKNITITTWERGAGLTLACGSASCSAFAVCYFLQKVDKECKVKLTLGDLSMKIENNEIIMQGPVSYVFEGKVVQEILN